jgi:hypothetical protein
MKKRPLPILILAGLFIAVGALGFANHLSDLRTLHPFPQDLLWVLLVGLIAMVSGIFMLQARNWARWLALAWMTFHVAISFQHSLQQVAIHAVLLLLIAYFLFRPEAKAYFHS